MITQFKVFEEKIIGRTFVSLYDHSSEILDYFGKRYRNKNKDSFRSAIFDWLDMEFYTTDHSEIDSFIDKYISFADRYSFAA